MATTAKSALSNRQRCREYYERNKEARKERSKMWMQANRDATKRRLREYYLENRAAILSKNKKWREENAEALKDRKKAYHATKPEVARRSHLKNRYGMSVEDFDNLKATQGSRCAACKAELGSTKDCHVDHCHRTGAVRGILCRWCNTTLGNAREDTNRLACLIRYLDERQL